MKMSQMLGMALVFSLTNVHSATIAIVDSGNDFKHKDLSEKAWINPLEIASNDRDEDRNGYPDDVNGWNFAESNNLLIDYSYSWSDTADVRKFFDIQLKSFLGTLTQADRDWVNSKLQDEKFIKEISVFGNWMHGTHVTGIAAKFSPEAKMVGIKLIPTEVKLPGQKGNALELRTGNQVSFIEIKKDSPVKDFLLKGALSTLAKQQAVIFGEIGTYIKGTKASVMNGSFGTSYQAISGIVGTIYKTIFKNDPTADELKKYTDHYFAVSLEESKIFLKSAPETLFVFAAGNEASDNDIYPTSPTNIVMENKISVAATLGDQALASFSNYGAKNVEVAAPGVGIKSTSPQDKYVIISGTSQAAPYVAGVAGAIKDANSKLTMREMKKIILETVDVKPWLKGKVSTSGIVNAERAVRAAELSRTMNIVMAIAQSKLDVLAKSSNEKNSERQFFQVPNAWVAPLPNPIIVR